MARPLLALLAPLALACTEPEVAPAPERTDWEPEAPPSSPPGEPTHSWDYVLFAPMGSETTWLVDESGEAVHLWESDRSPGESVYLLDDGSLLRTGAVTSAVFGGGGLGGSVQLLDWHGAVLWEVTYATSTVHQHHDVALLPNGNLLLLAWEAYTRDELLDAGRDPELVDDGGGWMEQLVEIDPLTGETVWTWRVIDHVAQDRSAAAPNFVGAMAEHPDRIDIDYLVDLHDADWLHANGIDYHAGLDQIALSVREHSEVWIIDRPTGEIVYRWGNPAAWGAGTEDDQELQHQHNVQWIDEGLDGAGDLLIFDNGHAFFRPWSRVVQITPPLQPDGSYLRDARGYGPSALSWEYVAENPTDFYASHVSGAQRQSEGTTLICNGPAGRFFGVDTDGNEVWSLDYGGGTFRAERYPADHPAFVDRDLTGLGEFPKDDGELPPL